MCSCELLQHTSVVPPKQSKSSKIRPNLWKKKHLGKNSDQKKIKCIVMIFQYLTALWEFRYFSLKAGWVPRGRWASIALSFILFAGSSSWLWARYWLSDARSANTCLWSLYVIEKIHFLSSCISNCFAYCSIMCDYCNIVTSVTYCQFVDAPTISLSLLRTVKK